MAHLKVCTNIWLNYSKMASRITAVQAFKLAPITGIDGLNRPSVCGTRPYSSRSDNDEKYTFRATEFSSSRSRDVSAQTIEIQHENHSVHNTSMETSDCHVESYDTRGGLNLSSVMQTTVPEPYNIQGKRSPSHLNMPGGNVLQKQKQLSDELQRTHHSRQNEYHTLTGRLLDQPRFANNSVNLKQLVAHLSNTTTLHAESSPSSTIMTQRMKFKQAVRDYGATVMIFHISVALCSLGAFYLAISSGVDVGYLLSKLPLDSNVVESSLATGVSTFALAYAVHKLFAPVRMGITVAAVPFIVRYLRKVGMLKPPKS
ncbi:hypothetical protein CHUAL_013536 [Chamberlinius hualienensis]